MISSRALRLWSLGVLVFGFALSFGLNGAKSNLAAYLVAAVRTLRPELWSRDFVINTPVIHPVFAKLAALLLYLDPSGWLIGLSNVAAVCAGMWCLYRLVVATAPREHFSAFSFVLIVAAASRTGSIGGSYFFSDTFQPSTLGSLALLAATYSFVRGKALPAGIWLALAGAVHLNYLVLALPVFGLAWLLSWRPRSLGALLAIVGPALPVLALFVPLLVASGGGSAAVATEARRILQDVRNPHHYHVATFASSFLPWAGFQLLGAAALWARAKEGEPAARRLLALLCGFAVLIVPAALLSSVVLVRWIDALFAWRVAPHANLLAQVAIGGALARAYAEPSFSAPRLSRGQRLLGGLGLVALLLAVLAGALLPASVLTLALVALALARPWWPGAAQAPERVPPLLELALALTAACALAPTLAKLDADSDLLGGKDRDLEALCGWVKASTPVDALLLTPPDEEGIRLACQRSIVADWKLTPVVPADVLHWYERIELITGRKPFRREAELSGYATLDAPRVHQVRAAYGADFWVVRDDAEHTPQVPPAYQHGRFRVYRLPLSQ